MYKEEGIDIGYMLNTMCDKAPLTEEKENELGRRVRGGDMKARNELVEHNLRLVVFVVKKFKGANVETKDIFMAGAEGLIHAADSFDPDRETSCRFSQYAYFRVFQYINRFWAKNRDLICPTFLNSSPECTLYTEDLKDKIARDKGLLWVSGLDFVSADEGEKSDPIRSNTIKKVLSVVDEKTAAMLKMYYGIGCSPCTLLEISKVCGYTTKEGVRQALLRGIKKIRKSQVIENLPRGKQKESMTTTSKRHSLIFKLRNKEDEKTNRSKD